MIGGCVIKFMVHPRKLRIIKNMRIIHYIPSIDRIAGGTSTYMQVLAKELGKIVDLHIITHLSDNPLYIENCKIHYVASRNPLKGDFKEKMNALFDDIKPDIVHINGCWLPTCAMVQRFAKKRGCKVVLTPHGMLEPWILKRHYWIRKLPALLLYQKKAIREADSLLATAESEKNNLLELGYNPNVKVIKLGIDAESIALKSSWNLNKQILFLSRVHVKKGINYLIEAARILRKELDGYQVIVAGEGEVEYVAELKRQIADYGLQDVVQLIGGVYGDKKWELFKSSDFFVLPTHSENFGLAIAESLASGTPVITTMGTPWEDLNTYHAGAYIDIGTNPLVDTMKRFLLLSKQDLEVMGRNGRKLIENKYSSTVMAQQMMQLYKSL